jgi:glyoxylase-like metal-dependent hydrolase (beta-lactamase superfamily II)
MSHEVAPAKGVSRLRTAAATLVVQLVLLVVVGALFPVKMWVLRQAIPTDYFDPENAKPDDFDHVSGALYAFRHGLNRSAVLDTPEGLAVFDTFSTSHARKLREELGRRFPGKPVKWVFYSHNHLDHIRGAGELSPVEVIAHKDVSSYVADWKHADVAPVTRALDGDAEIVLGGVVVSLLYLPRSHSQTLYAYYFKSERAVFTPDTAFIRSFPPFGLPDWYYPGYVRGLDRIAALDFEHCVPSHFEMGRKSDFLDYRQMMVDYREEGAAIVDAMGGEPSSGVEMRGHFGPAYLKLRAKYGSWRGFDAMFVPHFVGQIGGTYLGY